MASVSAAALVRVALRPTWGREGAEGLFEAGVDTDLRVPVEGASGQAGVYAASELLARPGRPVQRWNVFGGDLAQQVVEAVHAGLNAGADVVGTRGHFVFEGQYVCACNVFDVDVVAGLFPPPFIVEVLPLARLPQKIATTPASPCGSCLGP